MAKSLLLLVAMVCMLQATEAQYKFDNKSYTTVYLNDLCDSLNNHPDRLILDVRSPEEFADTSAAVRYNIGHLKGAVNIDINELGKRWKEIAAYQNKPVFIYCSHSQRSRICSKLLADSGFTQVYNINGAMTWINLLKGTQVPCLNNLYKTNNSFTLVSPQECLSLLESKKGLYMLDVRNDSAFRGISRDESENVLGRLKNSVNIPLSRLSTSLNEVPMNRPIMVVADNGSNTNAAAKILTDNGFREVYASFNGLIQWLSLPAEAIQGSKKVWEHHSPFTTLTAEEFDHVMAQKPETLLLDIRPEAEFTNQEKKNTWKNRGHINNALNIPGNVLGSRLAEINDHRKKPIILYAFNSGPEVFEAAKLLAVNGFTKVQVLMGGLWDLRWKAANIKGLSHLMTWVVDVPADNL